METKVLNYRIIIEKDRRIGTKKQCYVASCPTLGVVDDGDTVEEALKNIKEAIELYVECLIEEGKSIPKDNLEESIITQTSICIPLKTGLSFA